MRDRSRTSRFLSLVLRHQPEKIGIALDEHGWADVEALLAGMGLSREDLEQIVAGDEKMRYSFNEDHSRIRANQGHSIPVDLELEPLEPPEYLYHGTVGWFLASIQREGLTKRSRQYVHLSPDAETAAKVGSRRGKPVVLRVRAARMQADGYRFYRSANGVWLTDRVPPEYLEYLGNL